MQNDNMITVELETLQHGALYGRAIGFVWKGEKHDIPVSEWPHNKGQLLPDVPVALQNCYAMKAIYKFLETWDGEWV